MSASIEWAEADRIVPAVTHGDPLTPHEYELRLLTKFDGDGCIITGSHSDLLDLQYRIAQVIEGITRDPDSIGPWS